MTLSFVVLTMLGCDAFQNAKNTIEGLTDPVVAQGLILGVDEPDSPQIQGFLEGTDFSTGTAVSIFLGDANNVANIADAPIIGAIVTIDSGPAVVAANADGSGVYTVAPDASGLTYVVDAVWDIYLDTGREDIGVASPLLPPAAWPDVPVQHTTLAPMNIDLTGMGFDSSLIVVIDSNGALTFSNEPTSPQEVYDASTGDDKVGLEVIDASAFPFAGVYAVGVAGLLKTDADQESSINTVLSSFMAGKMEFYAVSTL